MSINVVSQIKKAEEDARKVIESAKKKAVAMRKAAVKKRAEDRKELEQRLVEDLKKLREEKTKFFTDEAAELSKSSEKEVAGYRDRLGDRIEKARKEAERLIKEDLCL